MKTCSKCETTKEDIEFSKGRNQCKICRNEVVRKYRKENSDKVRASKRQYRINNPEKSKLWAKKSLSNNKARVYERNKRYFEDNKEKIKKYQKEYRKENSEKIKETNNQYYADNSEHIKRINNQYKFNRKKIDPVFKLSHNIRTLIYQSISRNGFNKSSKTADILGCTFDEFRLAIESKFESWMSWENYGLYNKEINFGWDIDHIIPIASAKTEEEIIKLNHYTNLQPLCSYINRHIKRDN